MDDDAGLGSDGSAYLKWQILIPFQCTMFWAFVVVQMFVLKGPAEGGSLGTDLAAFLSSAILAFAMIAVCMPVAVAVFCRRQHRE